MEQMRVCISELHVSNWQMQRICKYWDIAMRRNRKGLLLPFWEEYLEVSYTYGDEGAALQDLYTFSQSSFMGARHGPSLRL